MAEIIRPATNRNNQKAIWNRLATIGLLPPLLLEELREDTDQDIVPVPRREVDPGYEGHRYEDQAASYYAEDVTAAVRRGTVDEEQDEQDPDDEEDCPGPFLEWR